MFTPEFILVLIILYVINFGIWVAALFVYHTIVGGIEFGPLLEFALKSALLVLVATIVLVAIPLFGIPMLIVYWIGLVFLFGMEFWEAKFLVFIIWALNFGMGLLMFALLMKK